MKLAAPDYEVKDSGQRQSFESGAVRDTQESKPRYDLISPFALRRVAFLMTKGAEKYTERNWELGMPVSRFFQSAFRHLMSYFLGDRTEDHLSAAVFNIMAIIHFEELGREDLQDMPQWKK